MTSSVSVTYDPGKSQAQSESLLIRDNMCVLFRNSNFANEDKTQNFNSFLNVCLTVSNVCEFFGFIAYDLGYLSNLFIPPRQT